MDAWSNLSGNGANVLVGVAVAIILVAMGCGWLLRALLVRTLRDRHPAEFATLGRPSSRSLGSMLPRHREMQLQFWKYLWGKEIFLLRDSLVSGLASAARIADVALVAGAIMLIWSAAQ